MSVRILEGDALTVLKTLPDQSVQMCVTSPPYFGLRDYGVVGQLGLEKTPQLYVDAMVGVFSEVKRVLRDDGTLWLNIGDSYAGSWGAQSRPDGNDIKSSLEGGSMLSARQIEAHPRMTQTGSLKNTPGCKPKDLIGIPWMLAFALRADGWYLRSDIIEEVELYCPCGCGFTLEERIWRHSPDREIIWKKPNPMPESVTDRPTKSHEYLFLLSKSSTYYYDADAVRDPLAESSLDRLSQDVEEQDGSERAHAGGKTNGTMKAVGMRPQLRRARQIVTEKGLTEEHIAAIRACGISDTGKALVTTDGAGKNTDHMKSLAAEAKLALGGYYREFLVAPQRNKRSVWTVPTMPYREAHFATFPPKLIEPCILAGSAKGQTVLDPFMGAGTTGLVADRLGRDCIGIELNPKYAEMARKRISDDAGMFGEVA